MLNAISPVINTLSNVTLKQDRFASKQYDSKFGTGENRNVIATDCFVHSVPAVISQKPVTISFGRHKAVKVIESLSKPELLKGNFFIRNSEKSILAEFFNKKDVFSVNIIRDWQKKTPVKIRENWYYDKVKDCLDIYDANTEKHIETIKNANKHVNDLLRLEQLVQQKQISKGHLKLYVADKIQENQLELIIEHIRYRNNPRLRTLVSEYKKDSKIFQDYTGCTDWTKRNVLTEKLEVTILPFDIQARRGEDWGFLDSKIISNGQIMGVAIRNLKNAGKAEIEQFVQSLGYIENSNFMSTSIGRTTKYDDLPVQYNIFIPQGTTGVYLEDLVKRQLLYKYESELLLQLNKKLIFKNIFFKENKCFINSVIMG